MARTGRWTLPPLYQSEVLEAQGKKADSDRQFVQKLLQGTFARFGEYYDKVAGSVRGWDRDRLYVTDIVLIAMGLSEAENFDESNALPLLPEGRESATDKTCRQLIDAIHRVLSEKRRH